MQRARSVLAEALARLREITPEPVYAWLRRLAAIEGVDRGMVIGAQAFTALFPLLIVASAFVPTADGRDLAGGVVERFDLEGSARSAVEAVFAPPSDVRQGVQVAGFVVLVLSALAFTRAVQRLYERSWMLDRRGVRDSHWGLLWLGAFLVWISVQPVVVGLFDGVLAVLLSIALGCGLWLLTPYMLVARRIPWRDLVPTAVLTAIGLSAVEVGSVLLMPGLLTDAADEYGAIGIAFILASWTTVIGMVLMATATAGAIAGEHLRAHRARGPSAGPPR